MKERNTSSVTEYILECLKKKYGTCAGKLSSNILELANDDNEKAIQIIINQK